MARKIEGGDEVRVRLDVTRADNETFTVRFRANGIRVTLRLDDPDVVELVKQAKASGRKNCSISRSEPD